MSDETCLELSLMATSKPKLLRERIFRGIKKYLDAVERARLGLPRFETPSLRLELYTQCNQ